MFWRKKKRTFIRLDKDHLVNLDSVSEIYGYEDKHERFSFRVKDGCVYNHYCTHRAYLKFLKEINKESRIVDI